MTELLVSWRAGDAGALESLLPFVYDELRVRAARYLARERAGHTLEPAALVHETFERLVDQRAVAWQGRAHVLGVAAHLMRLVLIDHARAHRAQKRGAGALVVTLDESSGATPPRDVDLIALDVCLTRLGALDERQARIVELRFFGGLSEEEVAEAIGASLSTVKRDWRAARAWLFRELTGVEYERGAP